VEVSRADVRLQPLARRRLASLGDVGATWLADLPARLDDLADRWQLTLGRAMPGGSASYVVAATTATDEPRVLKLGLPGHSLAGEHRVLAAAGGQGYVRCFAYGQGEEALLLERLGPSLEHTPMPPGAKLDRLVDTLRTAWTVAPADHEPPVGEASGAAKARELHRLVTETDARLPGACRTDVRDLALTYAERRAADSSAPAVVVHGDPHPANALKVRRPRAGSESGWCFVDPDGFVCDPAYDLGVLLRGWTQRLLAVPPEEARLLLRRWSLRVVERSGLGLEAADGAWEWAFLERVSTGLHVTGFGAHEIGATFLDSAAHLLD
jgi:streptomycin 6-kinase